MDCASRVRTCALRSAVVEEYSLARSETVQAAIHGRLDWCTVRVPAGSFGLSVVTYLRVDHHRRCGIDCPFGEHVHPFFFGYRRIAHHYKESAIPHPHFKPGPVISTYSKILQYKLLYTRSLKNKSWDRPFFMRYVMVVILHWYGVPSSTEPLHWVGFLHIEGGSGGNAPLFSFPHSSSRLGGSLN